MKRWIAVLCGLTGMGVLVGGACSISDSDRCASGYLYEPSTMTCVVVPDASATVQEDAAAPAVASEAGSVTFGDVCATDGECASGTTNFCLKQPGASAGYCSKVNCTADCPTNYKCCNCAVMGIVACMKDADATAAAAFGCSCS